MRKAATGLYKMLETVDENKALLHTGIFKCLKDVERDVKTMKVIQVVGSCELLWKELQNF
jgi:hypothetical protein